MVARRKHSIPPSGSMKQHCSGHTAALALYNECLIPYMVVVAHSCCVHMLMLGSSCAGRPNITLNVSVGITGWPSILTRPCQLV